MEVLFFIILFIVISVVTHNSDKKTKEQWAKAASKLKLNFLSEKPIGTISGINQACHIKVFTVNRGANQKKNTYTTFKITYNRPIQFAFSIVENSLIQGLMTAIGAQDIKTGSEEFDQRVIVKGAEQDKIINYLTPERQRVIKVLINQDGDTTVTQLGIEVCYSEKIKTAAQIISKVQMLQRYAKTLSTEGHIKAEASVSIPKVEKLLIPKKIKSVEVQTVAESSQNPSTHEKENPEVNSENISIGSCYQSLFSTKVGSQASKTLFKELYQERNVEWEGILTSVDSFSSDFIFKNRTGIKANFDLGTKDSGLSSSLLKATVLFEYEDRVTLEQYKNQKLIFTGTLFQLNPLVKTLFLTEGKVKIDTLNS